MLLLKNKWVCKKLMKIDIFLNYNKMNLSDVKLLQVV